MWSRDPRNRVHYSLRYTNQLAYLLFLDTVHPTKPTMFANVAPSRAAAAGLFPGSKLTVNRNHYDPDFQAVIFCGYGES